MPLLCWDKPERAMPVESWKGIGADSAPPGVYVPNMSNEDAQKWRAKLCGHKSGHPQVEIRTSKGGSQLLVIVSVEKKIKYQGRTDKCNVRMSMNGPLRFDFEDFEELKVAVAEASIKLYEIANVERHKASEIKIEIPRPALMIDDEKALERGLADTIARTYEDGIACLESKQWGTLFLDHDLGSTDPRKTGYGICCWLEQHPEHRPQKVILITNNGSGRDRMILALKGMYPEDYR